MISDKLKNKYPIHSIVKGQIIKHQAFGVFVKLEEDENSCLGLVQVTDINSTIQGSNQSPLSGKMQTFQVIAYTEDDRNQIWLRPYSK